MRALIRRLLGCDGARAEDAALLARVREARSSAAATQSAPVPPRPRPATIGAELDALERAAREREGRST